MAGGAADRGLGKAEEVRLIGDVGLMEEEGRAVGELGGPVKKVARSSTDLGWGGGTHMWGSN